MNPPLTNEERSMYGEIMTQLRHNHDELHRAIMRVDDNLREHVVQEDQQYSELNRQIRQLQDDVVSLRTKMGLLAGFISAVVAATTAWVSKVFF